jgi:hypothetical protein
MAIDLTAAEEFTATHARILDRRRLELRLGDGDAGAAIAALDGYRNPDGGYGWGLEPDLRSPESQPGAALHAFEVFEDISPVTAPEALELCDWLDSIALADGGLPFALPIGVAAGTGPWWREADTSASSLQITAISTAVALRVADGDDSVASHPWLERATGYCVSAIESMDEAPFAYVLSFSIAFADALHESRPGDSEQLIARLGEFVPADGKVPVRGGTEDETLNPLDIAPFPDRPARTLLTDDVISADLDRLEALQQEDGGWTVDYLRISPAGSLDWRGYATVRAIDVLRGNGRA